MVKELGPIMCTLLAKYQLVTKVCTTVVGNVFLIKLILVSFVRNTIATYQLDEEVKEIYTVFV